MTTDLIYLLFYTIIYIQLKFSYVIKKINLGERAQVGKYLLECLFHMIQTGVTLSPYFGTSQIITAKMMWQCRQRGCGEAGRQAAYIQQPGSRKRQGRSFHTLFHSSSYFLQQRFIFPEYHSVFICQRKNLIHIDLWIQSDPPIPSNSDPCFII